MTTDLSAVPPNVRGLVAELLAAELVAIGLEMTDASDLSKAGAYNAKRNGAPQSHVDEGLAMCEAFSAAASALAVHAYRVSGRWQPTRRQPRTADTDALFEVPA